jgi:hypothetical protein
MLAEPQKDGRDERDGTSRGVEFAARGLQQVGTPTVRISQRRPLGAPRTHCALRPTERTTRSSRPTLVIADEALARDTNWSRTTTSPPHARSPALSTPTMSLFLSRPAIISSASPRRGLRTATLPSQRSDPHHGDQASRTLRLAGGNSRAACKFCSGCRHEPSPVACIAARPGVEEHG